MSALSDFLARNSVSGAGTLPIIHSAQAYHIKSIRNSDKIIATRCNVFKSENLNYFFVGRPAYKHRSGNEKGQYWELPCCFIFDFATVANPKRIFPFDSGAFIGKRYPNYIKGMNPDVFEIGQTSDAVSKLIGAYFGDVRSYFQLESKDRINFEKEYSLNVFDEELKALHKLALDDQASTFDDRRFTIEIQSKDDISLKTSNPLAVIAPTVYFDDIGFRNHVENVWKAQPISYNLHPLSVKAYYSEIYSLVGKFFESRGIL